MNTNRQATISEPGEFKITASNLIRLAGLSAMVAGILFLVVQMIHPPQLLSFVTTNTWTIVHYLTIVMCLFGLLGITGIYARQVEKAGWLGLAGYLLFSLFLALTMAFIFVEAFIMPILTIESPKFVEGLLAIVSGAASEVNLGALPTLWLFSGLLYMFSTLIFGIATLRAGILSRRAAIVLIFAAPVAIVSSMLPHEFQRIAAVPFGVGLAWLGYALWSEQRDQVW
jgi:hypothetical protein